MKRWLKRGGIVFGVLALLIVAFYLEENWRGARLWAQTKVEYEAKGFNFDPKALIPPPVPDEQNFAETPIWKHFIGYKDKNGKPRYTVALYDALEIKATWQKENKLKSWNWVRGELLQAPSDSLFEKSNSEIGQLFQASQRPSCRFNIDYENPRSWEINFKDLSPSMKVAQALQFHALSKLTNKQSDIACQDISLCFKMAQGTAQQPFLISNLVASAISTSTVPIIWQGIETHSWSSDQLIQIQQQLGSLDLLENAENAIRGELLFFCLPLLDHLRNHRFESDAFAKEMRAMCHPLTFLGPMGWSQVTKAEACRYYITKLLPVYDSAKHRYYPERLPESIFIKAQFHSSYPPTNVFLALVYPTFESACLKLTQGQAWLDLAQVACGLERYRLAKGKYPATLAELEPKFIDRVPHDLCNGEPLHYRVEANGNYTLYSVGFNGVDDGGQVVMKKEPATSIDPKQGDWVWPRSKQ